MEKKHFVNDQSRPVDDATYNRFIALRPADCGEVLEELGAPRQMGVRFESPENRVFGFGDLVLKFYRPGRWDLAALNDELRFLKDLREAEVPFARSVGEIGLWRGMYYLAFERVAEPFRTDPDVLTSSEVEALVQTVARIHDVGEVRSADARPKFNARAICEDSYETILQYGYLPPDLVTQYRRAIDAVIEMAEDFGPIPIQRVHGDSYSGNALWRPDGPVMIDLDDFQMGPTAMDIPLLSFPWRLDRLPQNMDRKERRKVQHKLVLELYRQCRPFPEEWEALIPIARACRNVTFDAWMSARWNEPGFNESYEDDDLYDHKWWQDSIKSIEKAPSEYQEGWL